MSLHRNCQSCTAAQEKVAKRKSRLQLVVRVSHVMANLFESRVVVWREIYPIDPGFNGVFLGCVDETKLRW